MLRSRVYIVILNYQKWEDANDCLQSVLRSTHPDYAVLLVDNNSCNDSLQNVQQKLEGAGLEYQLINSRNLEILSEPKQLPRITLVQHNMNQGFAAGNNLVLKWLICEDAYTWLLNPDMIVEPDTMTNLFNFAEHHPLAVIGSVVKNHGGNRDLFFYGGGRVNYYAATVSMVKNGNGQLDYISGGSLFTHASNFSSIGLLPEEYFLYWEETDWCARAKEKGRALIVCPDAVCYDKISTVIGKGYKSDYYYSRNGLMFISRFRKKAIPFALMLMTGRWLKRVGSARWDRARGIYKGTSDFLKGRHHEVQ